MALREAFGSSMTLVRWMEAKVRLLSFGCLGVHAVEDILLRPRAFF
jgi:hypothetical protein